MTTEERVGQIMGNLMVQNAALQTQVETLMAENKALKAEREALKAEPQKPNGTMEERLGA